MNRPAVGVALLLALCAGGPSRARAETIAVFTKNQGSPIFAALRAGAAVAAKNLGVQVVNYVPSTADSVSEQNKLVDDAIKDKPDAIVFVPVKFTEADSAVKKINAAQIPLVNANEPLVDASIVGYVGTNDVSLARETGRYLLKALNGSGSVVILDGPDANFTAQGRGQGFRDVIKEFPDVKLLDGKPANYQRAEGKKVVAGFLNKFTHLDGILAGNDPMAMGAVDALKAANRKALVVGINASREVMDFIKSGDIVGSGDYDTFAQGCLAVEMAVRSIRKENVPKELILKPTVIDKTNDAPFDQPFEKRECPTLSNVDRQ
ncbi:MAG TPA: sugar ABC transporter substrate-binding protein [Xanthobacteraceae bacterium]|nr:sugar ABC transporter substrate-binding protein [Xanthobacteraceae bacterium]